MGSQILNAAQPPGGECRRKQATFHAEHERQILPGGYLFGSIS
jgi:hypothetical protein